VSVCCSVLQCVVALAWLVLQSAGCAVGLRCSVLPCVSVYCSVFQCVAVCCGVGPAGAAVGRLSSHDARQCCSVLQCVAVCGLQIMTQGSLAGRRQPSCSGHSLVHFRYYLFV